MSQPLLSIAIPTYNRADLLDLCLSRIVSQLDAASSDIELLVSNNASTDHTRQVVEKYQQKFSLLQYSENEKNGGPDYNIAKCFELATATYVWVFSDDDLLLPNALERLLPLLRQQEIGIVTLVPSFYRHSIYEVVHNYNEPLVYTIHNDPAQLAEETHFWLTYITGVITNKNMVRDAISLYQHQNSFVIQLGWVMPALFGGKPSITISTPLILGRVLEVLDFKPLYVFGTSYPVVLEKLAAQGVLPVRVKELLLEAIIRKYFVIYTLLISRYAQGEQPMRILRKAFWKRKSFWTVLVPLFIRQWISYTLRQPLSTKANQLIANLYGRLAATYQAAQMASLAKRFQQFGPDSHLPQNCHISHPEYVTIGRGLRAMPGLLIETHQRRGGYTYAPQVQVGNYVQLGANCRLDCCTGIRIGDWVLIGHQVTITDNEPDNSPDVVLNLPPANRRLLVRGAVIIEDNVLIEDNVRILSGVTIGCGAIIKSGAVVHESVLPYTIVIGKPILNRQLVATPVPITDNYS